MKTPIICMVLVASLAFVDGCTSKTEKQMAANSYLDDKVTTERVQNLLKHQHGSQFSGVHVMTTNGVVYLTGKVKTPEQRDQAGQLAEQIHRTKEVKNQISVAQ